MREGKGDTETDVDDTESRESDRLNIHLRISPEMVHLDDKYCP